ncbi:MAG TPA: hypothetical protein VG125_19710 [Pirellulales bacterium]|nr:hypothetical protein [Pirellulales bacterium]
MSDGIVGTPGSWPPTVEPLRLPRRLLATSPSLSLPAPARRLAVSATDVRPTAPEAVKSVKTSLRAFAFSSASSADP